jgi:hypothetical protein
MSQSDTWLREAKDCLESAQAATDSRVRDSWIELAAEWMKLAAAVMETVPGACGTEKTNRG